MKTDLLFALRGLRRAPAFFFVAVATLGLGIAANTAIFSLFYQVLLRSLPVRHPEQLVVLHSDPPNLPGSSSSDNGETVFSYPLYQRMKECRSLAGLAARSSTAVEIMINGVAERAGAEIVSGNFFDLLGIGAQHGRLLAPSDDTVRGGNPVAVLSYDFWNRRFGASPAVLNRTIRVNGLPFVVVGIAPQGFLGVLAGDSHELYLPMSMRAVLTPGWKNYDRPDFQWLTLLGRLAADISRERARPELQTAFTAVVREQLDQLRVKNESARRRLLQKRLEPRPASQGLNSLEQAWRRPLFVLLSMVLLLMVIGCANIANLLMARAVNRAREVSIRLALGAARWRIIRLLLTESALLGALGTFFGVALAPFLTRSIIRLMPADELGGWLSGELNVPLLGFSILLMVAATLLFGLVPALQATGGAASPLGERSQGSSGAHSATRKVLVTAQIAFSLVLLATAGLFGRSLVNLVRHQPGFRPEHLLSFSVDPGLGGYNTDRGLGLYRELGKRLAGLPGVTASSMAFSGPLSHSESISNVSVEGYTPRNDDEMMCDITAVGAGYFHTIGTAVLEGREFDDRDVSAAPKVAVVNQAFVKRFFGGRSAIGRKMENGAGRPLDMEIVGVVEDANYRNLRDPIKPSFYIPYEQSVEHAPRITRAAFFVRGSAGFVTLAREIRAVMAQIDSSLPVYALQPMETNVQESIYTDRLVAALSTAFGLLALLLTAVGLYGVIAYLVSRRTAEIGIRMVLGAEPAGILRMILGEVGLLVLVGGVAGIAGAIAAGRAIESLLYGVRGLDLTVFAIAVLVLCAVALPAAALPAIRAARIQPLDALRHE